MLGNISSKKLATVLGIVFIVSGLTAGIIFLAQYGISGFNPENLQSFESNVDVEKAADLQDIDTINIGTTSFDIKIISVESNEVKAHLYGGYSSSSKDYKPELSVRRDGKELIIKTEDNHNGMMISYRSNIRLDVYIPSKYSKTIDVKTTSGEVTAADLSVSELLMISTSGDMTIDAMNAGKAVIGTTSGEITVNGKCKELNINSTSGDIISTNIEAGTTKFESVSGKIAVSGSLANISANSTSGDISISSSLQPQDINISTNSGETELKLPASAEFKLSCRSVSGEVNTNFPITLSGSSTKSEHELNGTVGNGSGNVTLTSTSGDIDIIY